MNFSIARKEFLNGIGTALKAISSRPSLPILAGLLIATSNDHIRITGNNLEIGIEAAAKATVETEGSAVIDARLLYDIVRMLPEAEVNVKVTQSGELIIDCCMSEFKLKAMPSDGYPGIQEVKGDKSLIISANILKRALMRTVFAIGHDENRPVLSGVLLEMEADKLDVVALDGFRIARVSEKVAGNTTAKVIIPGSTVNNMLKILPDEGDVTINIQSNMASFVVDEVKVVTHLIEGEYINYKSVIPQDHNTMLSVNRLNMVSCLERVNVLNSSVTGTKNSLRLTITPDDGNINLKCETETGVFKEDLRTTKCKGESLEIEFAVNYLLEGLKAVTDEDVIFGFSESNKPAVMQTRDYSYVVLPVFRRESKDASKKAA